MTATPKGETGATQNDTLTWDEIDFVKHERIVRRLQARIVKASKAGKRGKIIALQRLLTRSFSAKLLAVERVTNNKGKNTPGVDNRLWRHARSKEMAVADLKQRGYKASPLRRVLIPKSNGKTRPLGIPTMKDRAMQALYLMALDPAAETQADPNSYGFRKNRSCADAIKQCFVALAHPGSAEWVLEGDIKACFDEISHMWLLEHILMCDKHILHNWLKAGYLHKNVFHNTIAGTPQGGIISPTLANIALDGLERRLAPWTKSRKAKVHYVRYADDFVITGSSRELLYDEVLPAVTTFLAERGLTLSEEKTVITHISEGFDFLGQNIRDYDGKILIQPSKKSVRKFLDKVRATIKRHCSAGADHLIQILNPIIQGWMNYHRHVCSARTFRQIDHAIFECLWRWAKRRHPDKRRTWIAKKYFGTIGNLKWCFFGETPPHRGEGTSRIWLRRAANTRIIRHIKIRGNANPYDPTDAVYFAKRKEMLRLRYATGYLNANG